MITANRSDHRAREQHSEQAIQRPTQLSKLATGRWMEMGVGMHNYVITLIKGENQNENTSNVHFHEIAGIW